MGQNELPSFDHLQSRKSNALSISKLRARLQVAHPHVPNEYIWTEDKDEIETSIINANKKKFRLADNTPFRMEPLLSDYGTYADTPQSTDILLGRYDSDTFDQGTKLFLRHLKVEDTILSSPSISNRIEVKEFQDYWKKIRKRTSSSPYGRHFGQ